jgi:hypothetical protein
MLSYDAFQRLYIVHDNAHFSARIQQQNPLKLLLPLACWTIVVSAEKQADVTADFGVSTVEIICHYESRAALYVLQVGLKPQIPIC